MKIFENNSGVEFTGWAGDNPFFLAINVGGQSLIVDLDEPGWMWEREGLMRETGEWVLVAKNDANAALGTMVLSIRVLDGEQPYYTKRHFGSLLAGGEIVVYGIGKKRLDGHVDRMWILPNGVICAGDDVDIIAPNILRGASSS